MVETYYDAVVSFLDAVGQSQFGAVSAALGLFGQLMATFLAILVFMNAAMQVQPVLWSDAIRMGVKLILIALFFQNWTQFNSVANTVFSFLETVGGALIASVNGASPALDGGIAADGYGSFAAEFDVFTESLGRFSGNAASNLGVVGGPVFNALFLFLMGLFSAVATALLIASRVALTILIGIAPMMILLSMFDFTKSHFERWLSAIFAFALFPVVISGVFATIIGLIKSALDSLGDPAGISSLGELVPVIMAVLLCTVLLTVTPMLVAAITGNFYIKDKVSENVGAYAQRSAVGGMASGARAVKQTVVNPVQTAQQSKAAMAAHAARINTIATRFKGGR
ncbi:type IV secretion system protein VirB6 [Primorskyibacter sedentarius]|uniref:Type IV secretion system protein VirB6 n=1 Tax=Primorskyibacter sedentarius TaxID=745311 RepID=A0A4R3IXZ3_9RHOB|nr:type IV secretion system protein [Primorskyibacter sedentarius]TCS56541.1 type IV secretion system protein VirB6 [Primorskyibacter sedentarius]